MFPLPFKLNRDRRHHIPRQRRKVTNWPAYDASLRQRGSLTVWFTDEAVAAWRAEPGRAALVLAPRHPRGADAAGGVPPGVAPDRGADKEKVRRAEQLDGKFVLTTNDDTLAVADVALGYKGMWVIESCFRRMKTTGLEVRPMFHWMPHRITAYVRLCVLALMIQRTAEIA